MVVVVDVDVDCHENFGPPKILVRGLKFQENRSYPDRNFQKFFENFGPCDVRGKVVRPLRVQRSMYSTAINRARARLLNCYQRIAINMNELGSYLSVHAVSVRL